MQFINELAGENKLSKGNAEHVAKEVLDDPEKMNELIVCLSIEDEIIQIRAMNAIVFISKKNPQLLSPYKSNILQLFHATESPETKWQTVQCFKHVDFTQAEQSEIASELKKCLFASHKFLVAHSMEALADHIQKYSLDSTEFIRTIKQTSATGSPALQARGRKVLKKFG